MKDYFPAIELIKKENFISLLYYYGMITMTGMYQGEQRLGIPNNNVRRQYYDFLLDEYQRTSDIAIATSSSCPTSCASPTSPTPTSSS